MVRGNTGKFRVVSSGEPAGSAATSPRPANVQPTATRATQPMAGTRPVVVGGGAGAATAFKRDFETAPLDLPAPVADTSPAQGLFDQPIEGRATARDVANVTGSKMAERRAEALMKGYTGESCSECNNFTMVRNGTCLKCDTCGSTSGCS